MPTWRDVTRLSRDVIKHSVLHDAADETQRDADKSGLETDESDLEYTQVDEISTSVKVTQNSDAFGSGVGSESTTGINPIKLKAHQIF